MAVTVPLPVNKTTTVLSKAESAAATHSVLVPLDCEAVLCSLFVSSITGTLSLNLYTTTENGKEKLVQSFPSISAPTPSLVILKAATLMGNLRVEATCSGACTFEVRLKGLSAGDTSVSITSPADWKVSQITVSSATVLIPVSFTARKGLIVKNWSKIGRAHV